MLRTLSKEHGRQVVIAVRLALCATALYDAGKRDAAEPHAFVAGLVPFGP